MKRERSKIDVGGKERAEDDASSEKAGSPRQAAGQHAGHRKREPGAHTP